MEILIAAFADDGEGGELPGCAETYPKPSPDT